ELDDASGQAAVRLEAVVGTGRAGVAKLERVLHERDRLVDLAQRQRDAVHAANGVLVRNVACNARPASVAIRRDEIELDAAGVLKALPALAETLGRFLVEDDAVCAEPLAPEVERVLWH